MKLKHKIETKIIVNYSDFEDIVKEIYGQEYDFVADMEGNSSYQFSVKKGHLESKTMINYITRDLENFKERGIYNYSAGNLLNDLADKDIIDEGNYLINVSW